MKKAEEYIEEVGHGLYTSYSVKDEKNKFTEVMSIERAVKAIKQAQIDAIDATVKMCTEDVCMLYHDGHFKKVTSMNHIQVGSDNIQINKQSILQVADKLKKELE